MMALIGGVKGVLTALGGAAIALVLFLIWNSIWDNPRRFAEGKDFGSAQERILWEESRLKALAEIVETKRRAQADLDQLEAKFFEVKRRASAAEAKLALEDEIKALPNKDEPVLPKRAADVLNRIGR